MFNDTVMTQVTHYNYYEVRFYQAILLEKISYVPPTTQERFISNIFLEPC